MRIFKGYLSWVLVILVALLVILVIFMIRDDSGDPTVINDDSNQPGEKSDTVLDPTPISEPVLINQYEVGAIRRVTTSTGHCVYYRADQEECGYRPGHLFSGDVIEIIGTAALRNQNSDFGEPYWAWPVRVLYGGIYVEGGEFWIPDDKPLIGGVTGDRPVPDFEVGNQVQVSYNFILRDGPAGDPAYYDRNGNPWLIMGATHVTITAGPTLGEDGRYWCEILSWRLFILSKRRFVVIYVL